MMRVTRKMTAIAGLAGALAFAHMARQAGAQEEPPPPPAMVDPNLGVRTVVSDLTLPIGLAFIGRNDFLVLEKGTGQVKRVTTASSCPTVLDLAVNNASERGLLGIALHPRFPRTRACISSGRAAPPRRRSTIRFTPVQDRCDPSAGAGEDTDEVLAVPLLGNRVDRFDWNGERSSSIATSSCCARSRTTARLPPGQDDGEQDALGNHDGGVIRFGPTASSTS